MKRLISLLFLLLFAAQVFAIDPDSVQTVAETDSLPPLQGGWVKQLIESRFHINDPRIDYPKFARFCVKVYNWGDKAFNSYDEDYVRATGKNWKLSVKSNNWSQNYRYVFSLFNQDNVTVRSAISSDLGISLQFMAVSIGYTRAMDESIYGKKSNRRTFDFSFTCSRFSIEALSQHSSGNAFIERFGNYAGGKRNLHMPFDGVDQNQTSLTTFYFFNHHKYSQSAAYAYSKYQLRSAGSWLGGFRWGHRRVVMDFSEISDEMKEANPEFPLINTFNYNEYSLLGGYAFNWVWNKHFLYNITVMPGFGYRKSELHSEHRERRELIVANLLGRTSITYNCGILFCGVTAKFTGSAILNKRYSFFDTTLNGAAIVGIRF